MIYSFGIFITFTQRNLQLQKQLMGKSLGRKNDSLALLRFKLTAHRPNHWATTGLNIHLILRLFSL